MINIPNFDPLYEEVMAFVKEHREKILNEIEGDCREYLIAYSEYTEDDE